MDYLDLPAEKGDDSLKVLTTWKDYLKRQKDYLAKKDIFINKRFDNKDAVMNINVAKKYIWNGSGKNPNAALTVFRHFDSASVSFGLVGNYPETAWVIDYPLLERIHYLLVAGFNVYGNATHQLTTRIYMDFLRMEAENHYLLFLPVEKREAIRNAWYVGMQQKVEKKFKESQQVMMSADTVNGYKTQDVQQEFYPILEQYFGRMAGKADVINRCKGKKCLKKERGAEAKIDNAMRKIAQLRGERLIVLPDVSFVRVRNRADAGKDLAYTVILNKAYTNITSMFENEDNRDRSQDTLTVTKSLTGSYPNFFFEIDANDVEAFVSRFESISNRKDYEEFVGLYGVRRTNTDFWATSDWFHQWAMKYEPLRAGIYDLNRYRNR